MLEPVVRKFVSFVEETRSTRQPAVDPVLRRVVVVTVLSNPFAGRDDQDLTSFAVLGERLGQSMSQRAIELLGNDKARIATYGKAALVGLRGELEHGAAVIHPRLGAAVRANIGHATTLMPSVTKVGPAGVLLDIPLHSVHDLWSVDHFDSVSIVVPDAPAPEELLIAIAMGDGGRPRARTVMPRE
jgi:hypothetical protein